MKKNLKLVLSVFAFVLSANSAWGIQAYFEPNPTDGGQAHGGSLGMDFVVNTRVLVTHLGVFDDDQNGIAAGTTLTAQLWSRNDNATPGAPGDDTGIAILASDTFTTGSAGVLSLGHRLKPLATPILLQPGAYTMVAFGYNGAEENGNTFSGNAAVGIDTGGGLISFVGAARYDLGTAYPLIVDGGPANRYHAGTFVFEAIPEPSTAALLLLGSLAAIRRGKRSAA